MLQHALLAVSASGLSSVARRLVSRVPLALVCLIAVAVSAGCATASDPVEESTRTGTSNCFAKNCILLITPDGFNLLEVTEREGKPPPGDFLHGLRIANLLTDATVIAHRLATFMTASPVQPNAYHVEVLTVWLISGIDAKDVERRKVDVLRSLGAALRSELKADTVGIVFVDEFPLAKSAGADSTQGTAPKPAR